jgi:FtsH-binding integral membrane protein
MADVGNYNEMDNIDKVEKDVRLGFISKVFGILMTQLVVTALFVTMGVESTAFQEGIAENFWVIIIAFVGLITTMLVLFCCRGLARKVPWNYLLLFLFVGFYSLFIACICAFYDPTTVLIAAIMTLGVTLSLTVYALTTKTDFTTTRGSLIVIVFAVILFAIFFPIYYEQRITQVFVCFGWCIVYGIYLVIDVQLVAGGGRYQISSEDYIVGAMALYVDIVALFIMLLRIFGSRRH